MKLNLTLVFSLPAYSHTFTGMVGFYDGLSHPVLGIDHFLAMVSVGVVSAQIGGRAIWTIPATFVLMMIVGGIIGMLVEVFFFNLEEPVFVVVEYGIVFSVILLGLAIAMALSYVFIMFNDAGQSFFELDLPPDNAWLTIIICSVIGVVAVGAVSQVFKKTFN